MSEDTSSLAADSIVVVVAHGSRADQANREFFELCRGWAQQLGRAIAPAFLELAEPSIPACIERIMSGAAPPATIVVVPYFLLSGNHSTRDIPGIIDELRGTYPTVSFKVTPYVGAHPAFLEGAFEAISTLSTSE